MKALDFMMGCIGRVDDKWAERRRRRDLRMLWPRLRDDEPDIEQARSLFRLHAHWDWAWRKLTNEQVDEIVSRLE